MTSDRIERLRDAVERGCREAVGSGRPEAVLREAVQPVLGDLLANAGRRSASQDEARLAIPTADEAGSLDAPLATIGRADAIYNRFVIEFEPPGSLRPSLMHSATRHAVGQVRQYLHGVHLRDGLPLERLAGCAFDGTWIVYVTWERGEWHETRPRSVDLGVLEALVETLGSLSTGRGLTADNLDEDYGRASECARALVPVLWGRVLAAAPRTQGMFRQWSHDLGVASGPFSVTDLDDWRAICLEVGVSAETADGPAVLFALQTYFSLVAKLVALIILEGATGEVLVKSLVGAPDVLMAFAALESGALTRSIGQNVIEPGVFSWYVYEQDPDLVRGLEGASSLAEEYSAEIVEVTPSAVRDVLKDLYQRLLPRSIRHRLGEYYTPDWLASHTVDAALSRPTPMNLGPETRVVDPACGSGTFLVEVLNRQVSVAPVDDRERTLELLLRNVVGFDVSPLAVQAAKVNYILALAPLLRVATHPVVVPIFLADSVAPPRRGDLLEGDIFVFESSEGRWELPTSIIEHGALTDVGAVVGTALAQDSSQDEVERALAEKLPAACNDPLTIARLGSLYAKIHELHQLERNGMWWQIIGNAFAPMIHGAFDLVVGNPPWVSWETLPEAYRRANDAQWLFYGLRPDAPLDRRQASAQVRLDLAMLFVARSMDRLLRQGGRLGFVITATVFKSELAGRGFRRWKLPTGTYRLCLVEDLSRLSVFDGATNQTAVMVAAKEEAASYPVPVIEWTNKDDQPRVIPTGLGLEAVEAMTERMEVAGEPVSVRDSASPLLVLPESGLAASRDIRGTSYYVQHVREGINTRGANGIFFVEVLARKGKLVQIRNLASAGRNREVLVAEGLIESDAVRNLLRGEDVQRNAAEPALGVLFFHDDANLSRPIPEAAIVRRFPAAYEYARQFEHLLRARRPFRGFDPSTEDWLGLYSVTQAAVAHHKVVFREISTQLIAAAVHSHLVIPDHKLHVIECESAEEADWLAEVMNSELVDRVARAFSLSTSIGGSLLRYIAIRKLSNQEVPPTPEQRLQRALGLGRRQAEIIRQSLMAVPQ